LETAIHRSGLIIKDHLIEIAETYPDSGFRVRGRGMIWGLDVGQGRIAKAVIAESFRQGLLIESSGADDEVLKVMPSLMIDGDSLCHGLDVLRIAIENVLLGRQVETSAARVGPVSFGMISTPADTSILMTNH